VIAPAALMLALAAPSRETLIGRWLAANRAHSIERLNTAPRVGAALTPPDLQRLAQRELSVPGRYRFGSPGRAVSGESWWQRAWDWIAERWHRFWEAVFGRARVGRTMAADIGDALLVVIGVLFLYLIIRIFVGLQFERSAARAAAAPLREPPSPRGLYKRACAAASLGDYGAAALLIFAATVASLDGQGSIEPASSATVGELRRALGARRADLVAPFDAVAAPFVQRAYAERTVDEAQWERARAAFESLSGAHA